MFTKQFLEKEYTQKKKSVAQVAVELACSQSKVTYWLHKHDIKKRSISDAIYVLRNPNGDPFTCTDPKNSEEWFLYGLGLGLFWGEGNKVNKHTLRLGNTDPALIKIFLTFLQRIYHIDEKKLRFGLQIFSDTQPQQALNYWCSCLGVEKDMFYKVTITQSGKIGNYRKKNRHGVLTVYFNNKKLRDTIVSAIEELRTDT